jgi:hypothetical protein
MASPEGERNFWGVWRRNKISTHTHTHTHTHAATHSSNNNSSTHSRRLSVSSVVCSSDTLLQRYGVPADCGLGGIVSASCCSCSVLSFSLAGSLAGSRAGGARLARRRHYAKTPKLPHLSQNSCLDWPPQGTEASQIRGNVTGRHISSYPFFLLSYHPCTYLSIYSSHPVRASHFRFCYLFASLSPRSASSLGAHSSSA